MILLTIFTTCFWYWLLAGLGCFLLGLIPWFFNREWKTKWEHCNSENKNKEHRISTLKTDIQALNDSHRTTDAELQKINGLYADLNNNFGNEVRYKKELQRLLDEAKLSNADLSDKLKREQERYSHATDQLRQIPTLEAKIKELEAIIANLKTDNAAERSKLISSHESFILPLKTDLNNSKTALEKLKAEHLIVIENKDKDFDTKLGGITQEHSSIVSGLNAEIDKLKQQIVDNEASLHEKISGLNINISDLEAKLADCESSQQESIVEKPLDANGLMSAHDAQEELKIAMGQKLSVATASEKDDLQKIKGVGGFIEDKLNNLGIYTFKQISELDDNLVNVVTAAIAFFPGRIQRDKWVSQATELMKNPNPVSKLAKKSNDDLTIVEGIGPKTNQLLHNNGVNNWAELAKATQEELQKILDIGGSSFGFLNPDTWPEQAALAAEGKFDELEKWQDEMDGGKR